MFCDIADAGGIEQHHLVGCRTDRARVIGQYADALTGTEIDKRRRRGQETGQSAWYVHAAVVHFFLFFRVPQTADHGELVGQVEFKLAKRRP